MTKKHEAKSPLTTSDTVHNHDPDLSTLQHRIHQAISCTLYASSSNPQEELDDLTKVTNALHYLDLWPIDTLLLNTMDATHVHEKLENVKLELIRNQLKETDKWIQKINGYETKLSENQSILANILDQCSKTHTMLGKFVEKGIEYQNQLMKLEVQKVEVENLVQQYALSSAESNVLSSPISVINETLFKALNKAIALKEKAIKDLDYPNTQLSLDLVNHCDMHLEAVYDRLYGWLESNLSLFSNIQPNLPDHFVEVVQHFQSRPIQLSMFSDEVSHYRRQAFQKSFEDTLFHGETSLLKSMFDPLRTIHRVLIWLTQLFQTEHTLWHDMLPTALLHEMIEKSCTLIRGRLELHLHSTLEEIQSDPMLAFKACQLLAMYRNDLSKFFSHASSMVESLSSLQSTAAQRFKTLFEQMLQDLFDEKEVPDPDLLPTSSILTLTTQLRELTQLHHQFPWPNETELKSILDAIIDPCLQYSIVVVQNLEHTQASIFLLNCFVEIKNSISTFFENKAATIENQIEIYVDSLVSEMVSFMETESGFSSLLTEVQALSSDNTLVHSGWTLQDIQNILVRLDTFLMDVHGVLPLNKLLSSELATRIRRNAAHLFLEDYRLVYEAIKSPKNGDSYSSLKLRTPDIIASILID